MNPERIEQIESRVLQSTTLSVEDKTALLKDLAALKVEAALLRSDRASEGEAASRGEEPSTQSMVDDLTSSVEGLEASHPQLTTLVNRVAVVLSNMGI